MSNIKTEVRQMLERRAADIDSPHTTKPARQGEYHDLPHLIGSVSSRRPRRRPVAVAAAVVFLGGLGVAYSIMNNASPPATTVDVTTNPVDSPSESDPSVTTVPDHVDGPEQDTLPLDAEPLSLEETVAALPAGVNLHTGPLIFVDQSGSTVEQIARDYLNERMPSLEYSLNETDRDGPLVVYRWRNQVDEEEDIGFSGSVIVRDDAFLPGVVAATTDQIDSRRVERTIQTLSVSVTDSDIDLLIADVFDLHGALLPGAANPDGFNGGSEPIFGTAGHTNTDLLEFDMPAGPIPVVVRIQHVGGTLLSISEFALETIGFANECGGQSPVSIDVGDLLSTQQVGTSPHATGTLLINQRAWHYPGDTASIEILWPANPTLTSRVAPERFEESPSIGFTAPTVPIDGAVLSEYVSSPPLVLFLGGDTAAPCSFAQVNVYGDDDLVRSWSTAISGEWGYSVPLTIADLDQDYASDADPRSNDLVVGSERATERPAVPATGSCNGLPDAPPRTGPGNDTLSTEPADALAKFLPALLGLDPPLPESGYTEIIINDTTISYLISSIYPLVVIDLTHNGQGWRVQGWSAAVC